MMKPNKYLTFVVALGAWLVACAASAQQNSIDGFNVAAQGGRVIVRITTKQPLAAPPASFTVTQPARIALDFPNTANALGRTNAGDQRGRAARDERRAGRRPHADGAQPAQHGDLRDAGRRQQREHRAHAGAALAGAADAAGGTLRRGHAGPEALDPRRRLPPRPERRGAGGDRARRRQHRHRHPPAGPAADRRLPEDRRCRTTCASASTWAISPRRSPRSARSSRARTCAW